MAHHLVGMAEIAEMLGVSRQRVAQLIASYEDFPQPEVELAGGRVWERTAVERWIADHPDRGPGRPDASPPAEQPLFADFSRFTDLARKSVIVAQEEARLFGHNYIGTEHQLLGLMAIEDGVAYRTLDSLDVSVDVLRQYLTELIGSGHETPAGHIPFTPRAKKVLEIALREALQMGHNYIGTEHILLALVREGEGVAWQMLDRCGLKKEEVRASVIRQLQIHVAVSVEGSPKKRRRAKIELLKCSFCQKSQEHVQKLIVGPGVYICDECIDLCNDIIRDEAKKEADDRSDMFKRMEALEARIAELESREDA